jgi:integrase
LIKHNFFFVYLLKQFKQLEKMANKKKNLTKSSLDYNEIYNHVWLSFKPLNQESSKKQFMYDLICRYSLLALETGLRYGDLIKLNSNDFILQQPVVNGKMYQFYQAKVFMSKTEAPVMVKVNYNVFNSIKQNIDKWNLNGRLFYNSINDIGVLPLATLNRLLKDFFKNTEVSSHSLRKTAGYNIYKNSNNIAYAQRLLGHKNLKSTLHYLAPEQIEFDTYYLETMIK